MELIGQTLASLRSLLDTAQVSSTELCEAFIARTRAAQPLNAYTAFDPAHLLQQATAADARLRAGERLPLLGIPIALKDNIGAAGFPCTAGTPALAGNRPPRDAEVVHRLREAGALVAGMLGMHELAFGITSNNPFGGAVRNPRDPARIPGGSSGGSGAAVAAGLVPAALGTDTGGSVRVPAALCGVAGFRPTVGRVPSEGVVPLSRTRDAVGPLALTIRDCATLDAVMAGDAPPLEDLSLRGLRLGVPQERFWDDLEPEVQQCARQALQALAGAGVELVEVALPGLAQANDEAGFPIVLHEFVRDLGGYLETAGTGITLADVLAQVRSPDVAAICRPLAGEGAIRPAAYEQALAARGRLQEIHARAFAHHRVEALVFPTTPRTAARRGDDATVLLNGTARPIFATFIRNTDPGSNAGLPGVSLPIGFDAAGLPIGLALDAPRHADRRLLAVAAAAEALFPPARPAPQALWA